MPASSSATGKELNPLLLSPQSIPSRKLSHNNLRPGGISPHHPNAVATFSGSQHTIGGHSAAAAHSNNNNYHPLQHLHGHHSAANYHFASGTAPPPLLSQQQLQMGYNSSLIANKEEFAEVINEPLCIIHFEKDDVNGFCGAGGYVTSAGFGGMGASRLASGVLFQQLSGEAGPSPSDEDGGKSSSAEEETAKDRKRLDVLRAFNREMDGMAYRRNRKVNFYRVDYYYSSAPTAAGPSNRHSQLGAGTGFGVGGQVFKPAGGGGGPTPRGGGIMWAPAADPSEDSQATLCSQRVGSNLGPISRLSPVPLTAQPHRSGHQQQQQQLRVETPPVVAVMAPPATANDGTDSVSADVERADTLEVFTSANPAGMGGIGVEGEGGNITTLLPPSPAHQHINLFQRLSTTATHTNITSGSSFPTTPSPTARGQRSTTVAFEANGDELLLLSSGTYGATAAPHLHGQGSPRVAITGGAVVEPSSANQTNNGADAKKAIVGDVGGQRTVNMDGDIIVSSVSTFHAPGVGMKIGMGPTTGVSLGHATGVIVGRGFANTTSTANKSSAANPLPMPPSPAPQTHHLPPLLPPPGGAQPSSSDSASAAAAHQNAHAHLYQQHIASSSLSPPTTSHETFVPTRPIATVSSSVPTPAPLSVAAPTPHAPSVALFAQLGIDPAVDLPCVLIFEFGSETRRFTPNTAATMAEEFKKSKEAAAAMRDIFEERRGGGAQHRPAGATVAGKGGIANPTSASGAVAATQQQKQQQQKESSAAGLARIPSVADVKKGEEPLPPPPLGIPLPALRIAAPPVADEERSPPISAFAGGEVGGGSDNNNSSVKKKLDHPSPRALLGPNSRTNSNVEHISNSNTADPAAAPTHNTNTATAASNSARSTDDAAGPTTTAPPTVVLPPSAAQPAAGGPPLPFGASFSATSSSGWGGLAAANMGGGGSEGKKADSGKTMTDDAAPNTDTILFERAVGLNSNTTSKTPPPAAAAGSAVGIRGLLSAAAWSTPHRKVTAGHPNQPHDATATSTDGGATPLLPSMHPLAPIAADGTPYRHDSRSHVAESPTTPLAFVGNSATPAGAAAARQQKPYSYASSGAYTHTSGTPYHHHRRGLGLGGGQGGGNVVSVVETKSSSATSSSNDAQQRLLLLEAAGGAGGGSAIGVGPPMNPALHYHHPAAALSAAHGAYGKGPAGGGISNHPHYRTAYQQQQSNNNNNNNNRSAVSLFAGGAGASGMLLSGRHSAHPTTTISMTMAYPQLLLPPTQQQIAAAGGSEANAATLIIIEDYIKGYNTGSSVIQDTLFVSMRALEEAAAEAAGGGGFGGVRDERDRSDAPTAAFRGGERRDSLVAPVAPAANKYAAITQFAQEDPSAPIVDVNYAPPFDQVAPPNNADGAKRRATEVATADSNPSPPQPRDKKRRRRNAGEVPLVDFCC